MRVLLLPLIAIPLLSACAQPGSEPRAFPPLRPYSPEVQAKAADELGALPPGSVLPMFMADYAVLRAQVRAMRK